MTARIAATDKHPVSAVSLHVGQRHGLVVERQVRDRPAALKRDHDVKVTRSSTARKLFCFDHVRVERFFMISHRTFTERPDRGVVPCQGCGDDYLPDPAPWWSFGKWVLAP
jgi:hypothetical protein